MNDKEYIKALNKLFELADEWNAVIDNNPGFFSEYRIQAFGVPGTPFVEGWEFAKKTK